MPNSVTTSVVVTFDSGEDDAAIFSAEVDSREDGLNNGDTSFIPGDTVYLLLHRSANTAVTYTGASLGSLSQGDVVSYEVEEIITFAGERSHTVSKPIMADFTYTWFGNSLGSLVVENNGTTIRASEQDRTGNYVGVAKITYTTNADAYSLSNTLLPAESSYSIAVYFVGEIE